MYLIKSYCKINTQHCKLYPHVYINIIARMRFKTCNYLVESYDIETKPNSSIKPSPHVCYSLLNPLYYSSLTNLFPHGHDYTYCTSRKFKAYLFFHVPNTYRIHSIIIAAQKLGEAYILLLCLTLLLAKQYNMSLLTI